jgi:molybdopterin synthase catalytic subunit
MLTEAPIRIEDYVGGRPDPAAGAMVVFTGVVRADAGNGRRVTHIHYDCYRDLALREMKELVEKVRQDTGVSEIRAVHRVGDVPVGDIALLVVVTAGHRAEAYEANRRVVEEIKKRVPIWKKEIYDDESGRWL